MVTVGLLALGASGCMSSIDAERLARMHDQRAEQFAARRDYRRAAQEQESAAQYHHMAEERAFQETATAPVLRPSIM
jgi:hypothetical protein